MLNNKYFQLGAGVIIFLAIFLIGIHEAIVTRKLNTLENKQYQTEIIQNNQAIINASTSAEIEGLKPTPKVFTNLKPIILK